MTEVAMCALYNNNKKFANRDEIFRKNENGNIVIDDVIVNNIDSFVQNWLLQFEYDNIPEELRKFIKKNRDGKMYRRFFAVRDLYRFLNLSDTELKYKVTPSNLFWYLLLSEPEFRSIKYLTEGKDYICKVVANVLATYFNYEIKQIAENLNVLEDDIKSDIQKQQNNNMNNDKNNNSNTNGNNGNNNSNYDNDGNDNGNNGNDNANDTSSKCTKTIHRKNKQSAMMQAVFNNVKNDYNIKQAIENINRKIKSITEAISDFVGKESVQIQFEDYNYLDVDISKKNA